MSNQQDEKKETGPEQVTPYYLTFTVEELQHLLSVLEIDSVSTQPLLNAMVAGVKDSMEARAVLGYGIKSKLRYALGKLQQAQEKKA